MEFPRKGTILIVVLSALLVTQMAVFLLFTIQTAPLIEALSKRLDQRILALVDLISQHVNRPVNGTGRQFPIYPEMNLTDIYYPLPPIPDANVTPYEVTISETFAEFKYSMPCMYTLSIAEFAVNGSMTSLDVHQAVMSYDRSLELVGFEIIGDHTALVYGTMIEDAVHGTKQILRSTYAWYCDASKIIFIIKSTAVTEDQRRVTKNIAGSICH